MITLDFINNYVRAYHISPDTDIFSILSQMQLECSTVLFPKDKPCTSPASVVEYSVNDLLNLFDS